MTRVSKEELHSFLSQSELSNLFVYIITNIMEVSVYYSHWGLNDKSPNLHKKAKPWRILVVVLKWRHRANGLLDNPGKTYRTHSSKTNQPIQQEFEIFPNVLNLARFKSRKTKKIFVMAARCVQSFVGEWTDLLVWDPQSKLCQIWILTT